jgi:hypothetical protein
MKKLNLYLCGGIQHEVNLGTDWRSQITLDLEQLGFKIFNPCEFEPQQLEGLKPGRLPDKFKARDGSIIKPKYWHDLARASRDSELYYRFKRYMQRIIHYDIDLVIDTIDIVIGYWNKNTGKGAGSHSEINDAFKHAKNGKGVDAIYLVVPKDMDMEVPLWIEGCCTKIFNNFEDLLAFLKEEYGP